VKPEDAALDSRPTGPYSPRVLRIDRLAPADWPGASAIYAEGIAGRAATFETEVPGWEAWNAGHLPEPRLVARRDGQDREIVGFAALSPISKRAVYAGVAEATLYVALVARREGVGRALLAELVARSEAAGLWTLQASILAVNAPSLRLFAALGFREVGHRERLGRLDGVWHDVVLMERRSAITGW
jgi:L-amino acid N-acyltransferase YncA